MTIKAYTSAFLVALLLFGQPTTVLLLPPPCGAVETCDVCVTSVGCTWAEEHDGPRTSCFGSDDPPSWPLSVWIGFGMSCPPSPSTAAPCSVSSDGIPLWAPFLAFLSGAVLVIAVLVMFLLHQSLGRVCQPISIL